MNLKVMGAAALFLSAAAVGGMGTANAADLGGDCCSDLEERVAELEATTARKGNRKVSLQVYGQVTTGVMWFDNGVDSDVYVGDNGNSPSRFGFKGEAKISPALKAGFLIEVGAQSAPLNSVTETDDDGGQPGDGALSLRFANWYLHHKSLGRLTVGRTSMAMDGIIEIDLAGVSIVSLPGLNIGGSINANSIAGLPWSTFLDGGYDGDRANAVRYDSANFGGFVASAAFGENDRWDVALRYAGEFSGFRLAAGIGYGQGTDNTDAGTALLDGFGPLEFDNVETVAGSASVMHMATGLFVNAFASQRSFEYNIAGVESEDFYWGLRAGIAKNWFGIGNTVLFGEYNSWDQSVGGFGTVIEGEQWGVGVVQNIDAAAMELFLSYKNHSADTIFGSPEDMNIVFSGARIKF